MERKLRQGLFVVSGLQRGQVELTRKGSVGSCTKKTEGAPKSLSKIITFFWQPGDIFHTPEGKEGRQESQTPKNSVISP